MIPNNFSFPNNSTRQNIVSMERVRAPLELISIEFRNVSLFTAYLFLYRLWPRSNVRSANDFFDDLMGASEMSVRARTLLSIVSIVRFTSKEHVKDYQLETYFCLTCFFFFFSTTFIRFRSISVLFVIPVLVQTRKQKKSLPSKCNSFETITILLYWLQKALVSVWVPVQLYNEFERRRAIFFRSFVGLFVECICLIHSLCALHRTTHSLNGYHFHMSYLLHFSHFQY